MTKPTPGPWKAKEDGGIGTDKRHPPVLIATASWNHHGTPSHPFSLEQALANANLIAAAPELLEALKCLVATHPFRAPRPGMSEPDDLINARAAIAKAEGR